jgi:hypothetical protein
MQESDHPTLIHRRKRGTTHELYSPRQRKVKGKSKKVKVKRQKAEEASFLLESALRLIPSCRGKRGCYCRGRARPCTSRVCALSRRASSALCKMSNLSVATVRDQPCPYIISLSCYLVLLLPFYFYPLPSSFLPYCPVSTSAINWTCERMSSVPTSMGVGAWAAAPRIV